jgi:hypothetical protein
MQDRVRKALERVFLADAPEFWFTIEMDWGGQFHLHGAVITPPVEGGRHLVDKALRDAGGAWASSKGQQYQQFSKPLVEPLYWASYVVKHMNISAQDVGGKLYASTRGIRSAAAERWDSIRNELPQSA